MTTARALSVTVTLVRPYVRLFVHQYVTPLSNSFDQNFCALSPIILFYICACCDTRFKNVCLFLFVEVKGLLGLCYMLYNIRQYSTQNKISMSMELGQFVTSVCPSFRTSVCHLCRIVLIRILWNLVTLFSTIISSSLSIMGYIAPCLQELWSFVYSPFETVSAL